MSFQDVVFLLSRAGLHHIYKKCGRGKKKKNRHCLESMYGGKQRHAPCKIPLLHQIPIFMSYKFHGDHKSVTQLR